MPVRALPVGRAYDAIATRQEAFTRYVTSEEEFRRTTTLIGERGVGAGATIVFAKPFSVSSPLTIPSTCIGVTVRASGKFAVTARGVVSTLFDIRAARTTISDVFARSPSATNMFTAFVTATAGASPSLVDNVIEADRLYVDASGGVATAPLIRGNRQTHVNATHATSVLILSLKGRVEGNVLADGGGDAVTVGAGSGNTTVIGNDLGGADVTTTASSGGNTVGVNTSPGTLTLHSSDVEVGNPGASGSPSLAAQALTMGFV